MSSSASSTSSSSSRKRVAFTDEDVIVPLIPRTISEVVSETERPQITSPTAPLSHSPASTTSTSESNSPTPLPSDTIVMPEAKTLDTYEPHNVVVLHPCLTISDPAHWNMLIDPQISPRPDALEQFWHGLITYDAFADSTSEIQINCDMLPWPIIIDIKQDDLGRLPRIEDSITSIYVSLWKLASSRDLNDQTAERQRRIQKAYRRRCRQLSLPEETDGLRRIDFLEGHTMFLGLSPGNRDDEWYLHVGQEY